LKLTRYFTRQELCFIGLFFALFCVGIFAYIYDIKRETSALFVVRSCGPCDSQEQGIYDVNHVSYEELVALPGVGKKLAARIVAYRDAHEVRDLRELSRVDGIGKKKLERLMQYLECR